MLLKLTFAFDAVVLGHLRTSLDTSMGHTRAWPDHSGAQALLG